MLLEPSILVYDDDAVVGLELVYLLRGAGLDKIQIAAHYEPALWALVALHRDYDSLAGSG